MKINYYSDPGHGWGAVKRQVLRDHGVLNKISSYSYQKGGTVYLEEDCDLPALVNALAVKGVAVEYRVRQTDRRSPIRNYDSFTLIGE